MLAAVRQDVDLRRVLDDVLLVRIRPSAAKTNPDPLPACAGERLADLRPRRTSTDTTAGATSTTASTTAREHASRSG